ncbi:MAG: hypothetical protein H6670_07785 [Anaerolineaceae bacterium]|nr:hypothetical protein [Anaerolineaceae bacterium]
MRFNFRQRASLLVLFVMVILSAVPIFAQDDDIQPAPASIGADIPLTYFGPAPSDVQRELIGPYQLLKSGAIDLDSGTITLPLYRGQLTSGEPVWYIITDTTDQGNAAALGLNFSSKLNYADVGNAVRPAHLETDGSVTFERGSVDFSPERSLTPGEQPSPFPPSDFQPGAVGDEFYTPLAKIGDYIYNAPIVAFGVEADQITFPDGNPDYSLVHDKVVAISPDEGTVTLALTSGFSFARPVLYLSTDANNPLAATMEGAVLAPALADITVGRDDSAFSAVERIFAFANGPVGSENPQRQGFNSALSGEGSPLNVLGGIPTIATDYSPLWDLNLGVWTQEAIDNGYRSRLTEEFAILGFAQQGWITGPDGGAYGSTGIIVNCPIVWRFL